MPAAAPRHRFCLRKTRPTFRYHLTSGAICPTTPPDLTFGRFYGIARRQARSCDAVLYCLRRPALRHDSLGMRCAGSLDARPAEQRRGRAERQRPVARRTTAEGLPGEEACHVQLPLRGYGPCYVAGHRRRVGPGSIRSGRPASCARRCCWPGSPRRRRSGRRVPQEVAHRAELRLLATAPLRKGGASGRWSRRGPRFGAVRQGSRARCSGDARRRDDRRDSTLSLMGAVRHFPIERQAIDHGHCLGLRCLE
jgi:hypothetical protein